MTPRLSLSTPLAAWFALAAAPVAFAKLPPEQIAKLPAPVTRPVDFAKDIQPIFEASCVQCHARGKDKGGFSLETRADFLEGGDSGAPAIAGRSAESLVIELVSGLDPETVMPQKGKKLTPAQVGLMRAWIDQGLEWPKEIAFHKHEPANLKPREIAPPAAKPGLENPLDRFVDGYFAKNRIAWAQPVDDRTFARRAWLDALGLLPPPAELETFLADRAPDKRARLVQRLLGDHQRYAEHWLSFWNDLLRNDYRGTGFIDGGRRPITAWLYTALARNLPYDRFVGELVNPGSEAEGFARGILWRGQVNASMLPPMQAAQGIAQVFMGVNLKCASCHDSFINEYTLKDSYGLAAIYADGPLEIAECDKPTGHMGQAKFLYAELGGVDANADPATRKRQLMEAITGRSNGRLPRTIVNRVWQRFLGVGLVEPVDEMDKPAWLPEALDWLAEDLVAHGFDLKHLMARILTSRAYQMPAVNVGETLENFVFRGPAVKRMSAEQFSDALMTVAGMTYAKSDANLNRVAALQATPAETLPLAPQWIWSSPTANVKAPAGTVLFKKTVTLAALPTEAVMAIAVDDSATVRVNGTRVGGGGGNRNPGSPEWIDFKGQLKVGANAIEISATNVGPDDRKTGIAIPEGPAGVILYARVRVNGAVQDFVSDASWATTIGKTEGMAVGLGGVDVAPWRLGRSLANVVLAPKDSLAVERAALLAADPLMVALGRPNREQVVTVRADTATTLQALEMTNGATLAGLLKQAGEKVLAAHGGDPAALVNVLYTRAISRAPSAAERTLAARLVGAPAKAEGVEDLLWALAMLPEFQLIK